MTTTRLLMLNKILRAEQSNKTIVLVSVSNFGVVVFVVLPVFNEGVGHLTFKLIFHKTLNILEFDCEITLESVLGINQY